MRTLKSHPLLKLVNSYLIDSAQPSNISYWWNFGVRRASSFVRENCPILIVYSLEFHHVVYYLVYYLEEYLYKLRLTTLSTSNKRTHWIAGKERSRKSRLPSIIARVSRGEHVEDNKLDTYKRHQFRGHILSRICRCVWGIVYIYTQRFVYWREASRYPGIRDSKYEQATKLTRTISGTKWEPRDLTAYARGRSLHTRSSNRRGLKGDSPTSSDNYSSNSGRRKAERDDKKRQKIDSSKQTASSMVEETLNEYKQKKQKPRNLIKILSDPYYLVKSYDEIKSTPGNMTKGANPVTLDKLNFDWFEKSANKLKTNQFEFGPSRRVEIPKPNSNKTRPLTIASPRDKIVQKAIQLILQAIWEKLFLDSSHGFRPNRSVHSALKSIYYKGQTYNWVVQGDIKCFDQIPHSFVIKCLREQIADVAFINLIRNFLSAGHIDPKTKRLVQSDVGIPQGGVLSPILCNIVLHKFDEFMANQIAHFEKGKKRKHNPEYQRLQHLRKIAKTQRDKLQYLQLIRRIPHGDPMDPNFKRMMYVRYADDFVILIIGSKDDATLAKLRAKEALKRLCGAELNEEKTLITHLCEGFSFLGAGIRKLDKNSEFIGSSGIAKRSRVITRRLLMNAPLEKQLGNLEKAGMIKRNPNGKYVPTSCSQLNNLTHFDIITFYNFKINGIINFYSFASNYSSLATIVWYLRLSCALTLARKGKLGTARQAFKLFGAYLEDPETGRRIIVPKSMKVTHRFQVNELPDPETYANINWSRKLTETSFGKKCVLCGSATKIEMHHLRSVKDVRAKMRRQPMQSG